MGLIHEAFEAQVKRTPQAVAVVAGSVSLTYDQVNRRANRLAHVMRGEGVGPETLVGVCLPRDEHLIPALLAVLKAGGAYVPLDPAYPQQRLNFIAEDSQLGHVITTPSHTWDGMRLITMDEGADESDPVLIGQPENAAYVIYTSGTTGRPKGAVVEHRHTMNLLAWARETYSDSELRGSLCAASICHDFSIAEIFPALVTGGSVILIQDMLELPGHPARDLVTMTSGVPSALATILGEPLPPNIISITIGGEVVPRALANRIYANPGVQRVFHAYGPTECTTYSTMYEVPREGVGTLPLGGPTGGAELSIHDSDGVPVADGVVGELWIGGPVVVRGYLRRPELNAEKFVELPGGGRAYRSGDLARFENGELYIHGRADDQVKVRGYRIELGEVEIALASHPSVAIAVVLAGPETLYGYVESSDSSLSEQELRDHLRDLLPAYMVPSRIAVLERIPLSPVGKADRRVLAEVEFPDIAAGQAATGEVAEIFASALGRSHVGMHDSFTDLGGHSLAAAHVCAQLRSRLGVSVSLMEFHAGPTVAQLTELVQSREPSHSDAPVRHHGRETYPLTDMQRSFWTARTLSDRPEATVASARLRVTGVRDEAAIQAALDEIVARHEVLRSSFEDGETAHVRPPATVPLNGGGNELLRVDLIWADPDVAELTIHAEHIAFDGWSIGVLMEELAALLSGKQLPPLPLQVGDLALHEGVSEPSHVDYWRMRLRGATAPHELAGEHTRLVRPLPEDLMARAGALGVTPFAVCLAALGIVVSGHIGRADTVLGAPFVRRDHPGTEALIGPLLGNLPIRLEVTPKQSFRELAAAAGQEVIHGLSHTTITFSEMVAEVQHAPGKPQLPILLSMQPDTAPVSVRAGGIEVALVGELNGGAGSDVVTVFLNRTIHGSELIVEGPATPGFADSFLRILEIGLSIPDIPVGEISLVSEHEQQDLLKAGCPPPTTAPSHVVRAFLESAQRDPSARAVTAPDGDLTYGELEDLSARIAGGLRKLGVEPGEIVGVRLERSRMLIAALLGIMRAGAAYVPLDPEHPAARLDFQISDCACRFVLSGPELAELSRADRAELPEPADGLAYVLYTSGSTGVPKGVNVEHVSLGTNLVAMRAVLGATSDDVVLSVSPSSFDVAHLGMWLPLTNGGRCVLIDSNTAADGHALVKRVAETGVTALFVPPTSLRMLQAANWAGDPRIRVMSAGEALDPALAREMLPLVGELWNGYGPTEAAIITTMHLVSPADVTTVPIGRPLPGYRVYVVDGSGRIVPPGVMGELCIAGPAVASGYRNRRGGSFRDDPYGTGTAYLTGDLVRWMPDRNLEYLGRRDHQVKVRGFRIELGEIETVLRDHPGVADTVVTAIGGVGETHLVGYVVWRQESSHAELETFLRRRLPEHMIPHRWMTLDSLPLNHNGKVDRAALPAPIMVTRDERPISTAMETFIAEIWSEILTNTSMYATSNFFSLGGHSFAATRVTGRIWTGIGCQVPVKTLFNHPVLAEFAVEVERLALLQLSGDDE